MLKNITELWFEAVNRNNLEVVKFLHIAGVDINSKDDYGFTALIYASRDEYLELVKYLIDVGADINIQNRYGTTALLIAANIHIVKVLVEAGADINLRNDSGHTAPSQAEYWGRKELVDYFQSLNKPKVKYCQYCGNKLQ